MITFIGAGPGDPELLTLKGKRLIDEADVIIYAGSLVNPEVLSGHKEGAKIYNSALMDLDEVIDVMEKAEKEGKKCVRVGVSSFLGTAAVLNKEFTMPGKSQTVILTRMEGRTPMPAGEKLPDLARHHASMVIFLSIGFMDEMVRQLEEGGYEPTTPVAVVYKATWPDQKIVTGTLSDIAQKVKDAGIKKTALTVVGDFLGDEYELSKLYDKHFTTEFRKGVE